MIAMSNKETSNMVSRDAAVLGDPLAAVTVCLDDDTRGLLNLFTE